MRQSIEIYFLVNFVMDAALLAVVSRALGCQHTKRILFASGLGACYAVAVEVISPRLSHPVIQAILGMLIALIICDSASPGKWAGFALQVCSGALMLGGIGLLLRTQPIIISLFGFLGGLLLLHTLLRTRANRLTTWTVVVCVYFQGRCTRFRALVDTGNRVREPLSGRPILIAEASLLKDLLPHLEGVHFRSISFGALGGNGTIRCFQPDLILIEHGEQFFRAPDVWIALYPGCLPGRTRALAPPVFANVSKNSQLNSA